MIFHRSWIKAAAFAEKEAQKGEFNECFLGALVAAMGVEEEEMRVLVDALCKAEERHRIKTARDVSP